MKTGTFSLVWRYFLNNMNILLLTFQNKFVFGLIGRRPHVSSLLSFEDSTPYSSFSWLSPTFSVYSFIACLHITYYYLMVLYLSTIYLNCYLTPLNNKLNESFSNETFYSSLLYFQRIK